METQGTGLRIVVQAPLLTTVRAPIKRTMLVPLLRAAGLVPLDKARAEGYEAGTRGSDALVKTLRGEVETIRAEFTAAKRMNAEIEQALGVRLRPRWGDEQDDRVAHVLERLREVMASDDALGTVKSKRRDIVDSTRRAITHLEHAIAELGDPNAT